MSAEGPAVDGPDDTVVRSAMENTVHLRRHATALMPGPFAATAVCIQRYGLVAVPFARHPICSRIMVRWKLVLYR